MRLRTLALSLAMVAAARAGAAEIDPAPSGLVVSGALGGGVDAHRGGVDGLTELEVAAGWELGEVRPEIALVLGLSPGTFGALRPGVHVSLPGGPLYARAALDWAHDSGEWELRWLVAGIGGELRVTSVLAGFAEVDAGIPLRADRGVGLLARAGFAFRF